MIVDLLKSYTTDTTSVTAFSVGTFTLDCQLEESHESRLTKTSNPIESGALIADHSYLENKRYAVRGIVISYEPFNIVSKALGAKYDYTKTLPLPIGISASISQAEATINRYASTALQVANKVRKLAPWLTNSLGWLGDETPTTNRYEKIYSDLLSIQASGELLTVTSGLMTYKNMTLVGVIANKGTDDSVEVALDFEETHIAETRTVSGLVVNVPQAQQSAATNSSTPSKPNAPKTGRSADQSATAKSKGETSPTQQTEAKKKSVLKGWFE